MLNMMIGTLPAAISVLERLMDRYGPERLGEVRPAQDPAGNESGRIFLARLNDGVTVQAVVQMDGSLCLRELEDAG